MKDLADSYYCTRCKEDFTDPDLMCWIKRNLFYLLVSEEWGCRDKPLAVKWTNRKQPHWID